MSHVAFQGSARLATGALEAVAVAARCAQHAGAGAVLVFDRETGQVIDLDLRGSEAEVRARHAPPPPTPKRGRPSLGVVAREVTLLPRHWEWLAGQPGGASITLRRLVEAARKSDAAAGRARVDAAYRFLAAIAGDLAGFEEAARALFARDRTRLATLVQPWPGDIADELTCLLDGPPAETSAPLA